MKKIFAFAASLLLAVGCTAPAFEENINNNENGEYDVLYAAVDNEASKVLIDAANDLSWNAGDQISVWHNTNNKPYAFQGADGDKVGEFKYQLFGGSTTQTTFSQIYALYPYAETSAINEADETISYTIPAEQTYREGTVAAGAAVMTAIAKAGTQVNNNKNALQFKNAMSFLRVQLKGEGTVKSVAITANSGEALAGNVTISHDENNIPAFTVAEEGASSTLTLNCGEGVALDKEEITTFWMAVRPVVLATGMTVTVTTADDAYTFLVEVENLTFERNKINKITREIVRSPYKSDAAFVQSEDGETRNYTLGATTVNELSASGFKLGTGSYAGVFTSTAIGVEGEKYLNFYAIPWNGKTAELYFRVNDGAAYYHALEGTTGASGNVPYTLTVGEEQHYSIKLSGLTAASVISFSTDETFTAASNSTSGRAVLFGITLTDEALGNEITGEKPEVVLAGTGDGTETSPYDVTRAKAAIDAYSTVSNVYVKGIITPSPITFNSTYNSCTYYISEDGTTNNEFMVYSGLYLDGENFTSANQIHSGDEVVVYGNLKLHYGTHEFDYNNYIVSHVVNETPRILSISTNALSFGADGGDKTVEVETFGDSTFDFTINYEDVADWLTVTEAEGVITVTANENTDTESGRNATITITYGESTETVTVNQGKKVVAGVSVNDVLNNAFTGITGTSYKDWTGTGTSGAAYKGQSAGDAGTIQMRSKNSNSGIVTTTSGGRVTKVVIKWNSDKTNSARVLSIYGKNSAYTAATDLYNSTNQGTKIADVAIADATDGVSTVVVEGDYEYLGIRSKDGALYLNEITITWEK